MADSILKHPGSPSKPKKNRRVQIQMIKGEGEELEGPEENERKEEPKPQTYGWFTEFLIGCGCLPTQEDYQEE